MQVAFERVQVAAPEPSVALDPVVDGCQAVGAQRVDPTLSIGADFDKAYFAQYAQVSRHRRLRQVGQRRDQFAGRALAAHQYIQQSPPVRFGNGLEDIHTRILLIVYIDAKLLTGPLTVLSITVI